MTKQNKLQILNLEPEGYSSTARKILDDLGSVDNGPLDRSELKKYISKYDILIVRLGHMIDKEIINKAAKLKVIVSATTGLNHVDTEYAESRGIVVLSLKDERDFLDNVYGTAEHTWALLLALIRGLPHAHQHVMNGEWNRDIFRGYELHSQTLGIIGVGRLGSKVARYGKAFGMKVLGYDIQKPEIVPAGMRLVELDDLLVTSDVVSLHVNLTPQNRFMIGENELKLMKKEAFLINTSRGELINEDALLSSLVHSEIGGAALDVLTGEYSGDKDSDLLIEYARNHSNLIITPHIGGCTFDSMEKTEIFMAKKIKRIIQIGVI